MVSSSCKVYGNLSNRWLRSNTFKKKVNIEDIMGLPCFWEIQLINHFAYSFEYGKWASTLRG
jgi:hypothetical protein